ncbi:hypothetical protein ACN47E_002925 [Coniothyrium glycines]
MPPYDVFGQIITWKPHLVWLLQHIIVPTSDSDPGTDEILGVFSSIQNAEIYLRRKYHIRIQSPGPHKHSRKFIFPGVGEFKIDLRSFSEKIETGRTLYGAMTVHKNRLENVDVWLSAGEARMSCVHGRVEYRREDKQAEWIDVKEWVDETGMAHMQGKYNSRLKGEEILPQHHWFVKKFRVDELLNDMFAEERAKQSTNSSEDTEMLDVVTEESC